MGISWRINYSWSNLGCIKSVFGGKRFLIDTERKKEEDKMIAFFGGLAALTVALFVADIVVKVVM